MTGVLTVGALLTCVEIFFFYLNMFTDFDSGQGGQVKLAGDAFAEITGKGTAIIKTKRNGDLCDVSVFELRHNLLSVAKITDKGYKVVFDKLQAEIIDKQGVRFICGRKKDGV